MLSTNTILKELAYAADNSTDIISFLEKANDLIELNNLNEAQYNKIINQLRLDTLDPERFVKANDCQPITNPRAFVANGIPSDDGLLSNKIFGNSIVDRSGIFAYIDLHGWFIDPSCYKAWTTIDSNIRKIVHGEDYFRLNDKNEIVQDPDGKTGIQFLKSIISKVQFKSSESVKRDIKVKYLEANRNKMFIQKMIVIPAYYRDKNTSASNGSVGLGGVNKLYNNLIIASNALTATADYLFDASDAMRGRVQEIILSIYDWFCGNNNKNLNNVESGVGLSSKLGLIRRAGTSKTADFSSRLVISASELKAERPEEMLVDFTHSAIPLAATIAQFRDFILFHVKRFFENQFASETYPIYDNKTKQVSYARVKNPEIIFSDERIKVEMERYIHGYNNRFKPIEIPIEGTNEKYYMAFKGKIGDINKARSNPETIYQRYMTWCDIFYIAAVEATTNRQVLITRFPIDSYANQITTSVRVSSTKDTEPMIVNDKYYSHYPKIRQEDIGTNTSNKFVDTIQICDSYLKSMGADFDGDQITCKGVYTEEANNELREFMYNNKQNFITFGGQPLRVIPDDCVQAMYAISTILHDTPVTEKIEFN